MCALKARLCIPLLGGVGNALHRFTREHAPIERSGLLIKDHSSLSATEADHMTARLWIAVEISYLSRMGFHLISEEMVRLIAKGQHHAIFRREDQTLRLVAALVSRFGKLAGRLACARDRMQAKLDRRSSLAS